MMRIAPAVFALILIGCASAAPDSKKAALDEPQIVIRQLSNVAEAALSSLLSSIAR